MARNRKKKQTHTDDRRKLVTWLDSKSPIAEQYRTIRTNIQYSSLDKALQTLVVTSAGPGEGKSTTVANLAVAIAQQEKKTLLIDADLRKPTVHHTFERMNNQGLVNALTQKSSHREFIQETDIPHLDILASGPIPPSPSEILGSSLMEEMFVELKQEYDMILFDAPPVLPVTDVQVLSRHCDGSILVIKSGETDKNAGKKAKELLEVSGVPILGTILNERKALEQKYYYYYGEK